MPSGWRRRLSCPLPRPAPSRPRCPGYWTTPARTPRRVRDHAVRPARIPAAGRAAGAERAAGEAGMSAVSPASKAARHTHIASILEQADGPSPEELSDRLGDREGRWSPRRLHRDTERLGPVLVRTAANSA